MKKKTTNEIAKQIEELSLEELNDLVESLYIRLSKVNVAPDVRSKVETFAGRELAQKSELPNCPHCGALAEEKHIIRKGYNRNGAQRYRCKKCGSTFVASTGTVLSGTHKTADTWRKFIELTIKGRSLKDCEWECDISHQTACDWRQKVLSVFDDTQKDTMMSGIVEADEMQIPISYKGNHIQGAFGKRKKGPGAVNNMPRKAYRRGSDNKSRSSKEKACVFCMVENTDKRFYAAVPGVGFMNEEMLDVTVAKHINKTTAMLLVDQYKITRTYLDNNNYKSLVLAANTSDNPHDHKPEIQGENRELHLQHVNAFHHHIRAFLKPYCGVSSKYLSNYIGLYTWIKNNAIQRYRQEAVEAAEKCITASRCSITATAIREKPSVPLCA